MGLLSFFGRKKAYKVLDGYVKKIDGYTENPLGHAYESTTEKYNEYFMQWVYPQKLHWIALRTPIGYRLVYKRAEDVWNNSLGIKVPEDEKKTKEINSKLIPYLRSRKWFTEMQKFSAYRYEQGEAILLCYYKDQGQIDNYKNPVTEFDEIIGVEAFNPIDYWIPEFDKYGEPKYYQITVKGRFGGHSLETVQVHPSRVIRSIGDNVDNRFTGYPQLASVYDAIVILSTILKATAEAAFRWGTGHPVFFTKGLVTDAELQEIETQLGDFTRRSIHIVPSEVIDHIDLLGEAGSMLNIKALADICIDQIIAGTGYPRPVLLGEVAGVISGSEVNERAYFALLDADHTELEPIVREYFKRDKNIRKLFNGVEHYEIDWGIRQILDRVSRVELEQKEISNALALTQICTIDECRERLGYKPIGPENYGDVVLGLEPFYMFELQTLTMMANQPETKEPQTNTTYNQMARSTEKQQKSTQKDLEKDKTIQTKTDSEDRIRKLKDAIIEMRQGLSINDIKKETGLYEKTIYKLLKWAES